MDAGTLELILFYVLSAIATFAFVRSRARRRYMTYTILAALLWPAFFVYATVREFSNRR
jgi:hypothetical protein